jgi:nucleoside-diphosphate-sugar epimerase
VLVTGAAGFTGRYVLQALRARGWEAIGAVHGRAPGPDEVAFDLGDPRAVQAAVRAVRPQAVVHLAAIAFVAHEDVEAIYRVNVVGTRHLLAALADLPQRPEAVLLASSANVYGNAAVPLIDEEVVPAPVNDYAVSKLAMEYLARTWMERLPIVIARPFNYTGVGQSERFVIPKLVAHFARRAPEVWLGNIEVAREFNDVRMVADAYARLLERGEAGRVYNVCTGRAVSLREVIGQLEQLTGHRLAVRVDPALVRANEVVRLAGDNRRLVAAIGPLREFSLRETLSWMLAQERG